MQLKVHAPTNAMYSTNQILHCLQAIEFAMKLNWYNPATFDIKEYEYYEKLEHGDINWIIPKKLLAFSSPNASNKDPDGYFTMTPDDYVPIFKKMGVSAVVRLNKEQYDKKVKLSPEIYK
jgi:cell division cycle 14